MAVIEAEGEADEVRVEPLPHVHLHRERLSAGDQAPSGHQRRPREPEHDDRADEEPELVPVVRGESAVDHVLRDPDEGDLRAL